MNVWIVYKFNFAGNVKTVQFPIYFCIICVQFLNYQIPKITTTFIPLTKTKHPKKPMLKTSNINRLLSYVQFQPSALGHRDILPPDQVAR